MDQFPENPSGFGGGGGGGNNNNNESFNSTRIRNLSGKTSENGDNFNNTTTGNNNHTIIIIKTKYKSISLTEPRQVCSPVVLPRERIMTNHFLQIRFPNWF
jgi:hypothetical protein